MEVIIDCGGIATKQELHEHIAEALRRIERFLKTRS